MSYLQCSSKESDMLDIELENAGGGGINEVRIYYLSQILLCGYFYLAVIVTSNCYLGKELRFDFFHLKYVPNMAIRARPDIFTSSGS